MRILVFFLVVTWATNRNKSRINNKLLFMIWLPKTSSDNHEGTITSNIYVSHMPQHKETLQWCYESILVVQWTKTKATEIRTSSSSHKYNKVLVEPTVISSSPKTVIWFGGHFSQKENPKLKWKPFDSSNYGLHRTRSPQCYQDTVSNIELTRKFYGVASGS